MVTDVFNRKKYVFPYTDVRFPGMNSGERILFITRESLVMLRLRQFLLFISVVLATLLGWWLLKHAGRILPVLMMFVPLLIGFGILALLSGLWWMGETYRKSLFIITTRRLTKIIHTTPFTWYQFSLGLDEIEDTGSYGSSYLEAIFGLGYFVARSGAGAIKNFKIVNITYARDLHNYVNKLLYVFKHHGVKMEHFRPFIADLHGDAREEFFRKFPQCSTEF